MKALIKWDSATGKWVLELWDSDIEAYKFSKAWSTKDEDENDGYAWVNDSILCEIAKLQDLGYEVTVTV